MLSVALTGEDSMFRRLAAPLAGIALAVAMPTTTSSAAAPVARTACTRATIGGQSKCIARGQFCARRYASQYRRYGLTCTKRDARGRYHLS
jgi:hypothetical protein